MTYIGELSLEKSKTI